MTATLVPLDEGQAYRIDRPVTVVGRRKFVCSLYLPDRRVSQLHCVIQRTDDGDIVLRDLGSTNGTRVNGRKVTEGVLMPGDELTFAANRFRLEVDSESFGQNANRDYMPSASDTLPDPRYDREPPQTGTDADPYARVKPESSQFGDSSVVSQEGAPIPEMESSMKSMPVSGGSETLAAAGSDASPRKVESLEDASKLGERAPYTTLQAKSAEEFRSFLADDSDDDMEAEAQTEIIRSADSPFGGLVDWSEFPKTLSEDASLSDYTCSHCEGSRLVQAPYSWWQSPLKLLNKAVYCCPCCYRRAIHTKQ